MTLTNPLVEGSTVPEEICYTTDFIERYAAEDNRDEL